MFARLGQAMARARWIVVGVWLAIAVVGGVVAGPVFDRLSTVDNLGPGAESMVAKRRIDQLVPEGPKIVAVIQDVGPYEPQLVTNVTKISGELRDVDGVKDVDDLYTSRGGRIGADNNSSLISVELESGLSERRREAVEDDVIEHLRRIDAPRVLIGGEEVAQRAFAEQATSDAAFGESIAFVFLIVALIVIFGGVVAAGLPLAVALVAIAATLVGLFGLLALTDVSEYAVNVVTLLGIGLAVDYSLLLVARYREERAQRNRMQAIGAATEHAGKAVLVSGVAVGVAMLGLYAFAEPLLAAMAFGGAIVVVLATAVALTLVPALLAIAGDRIPPAGAETWVTRLLDRLPRRAGRPRQQRGLLGRLAAFAQRRPGPVAVTVTTGLLLLAAPFLGANLANSDARALPRSMEARQAYEALQSGFNNNHPAPVSVVAEVSAGAPQLRTFLNQLNGLPEVFRLELRMDVPEGTTVIDLTPKGDTAGPESRSLVREVREISTPFRVRVAGDAAELVDYQRSVANRLPVAVLVVLVATAILLFWLTGSLVVPVKALFLNVLTLLATLGILVVLFQWGWGAPVLRFESWGALDLTTPLLLFVFIFGLSMDYEVFLLARIKEEWDRTRDNDRAVLAGITKTGRVITSAAVCIGIVFLGFALGDLVAVKEIGVGMAIAILLDVTVVRGLLLPAVMTLLGDWNWWAPKPLRRLSGAASVPAPRRPPRARARV